MVILREILKKNRISINFSVFTHFLGRVFTITFKIWKISKITSQNIMRMIRATVSGHACKDQGIIEEDDDGGFRRKQNLKNRIHHVKTNTLSATQRI